MENWLSADEWVFGGMLGLIMWLSGRAYDKLRERPTLEKSGGGYQKKRGTVPDLVRVPQQAWRTENDPIPCLLFLTVGPQAWIRIL
jgi:hypothetical protein